MQGPKVGPRFIEGICRVHLGFWVWVQGLLKPYVGSIWGLGYTEGICTVLKGLKGLASGGSFG